MRPPPNVLNNIRTGRFDVVLELIRRYRNYFDVEELWFKVAEQLLTVSHPSIVNNRMRPLLLRPPPLRRGPPCLDWPCECRSALIHARYASMDYLAMENELF